jgi:hypothetical protein
MRAMIMAIMLVSSPALAQSVPSGQIPVTIGLGLRSGTFDAAGELDIYRVKLQQGQDYAFGAITPGDTNAFWTVKGPTGAILFSREVGEDEADGFEFRAGRTGTFTIQAQAEYGYPFAYTFRIDEDCRNNAKTKCTIKPSTTKNGALSWYLEADWLKLTNLTMGKFYTATLNMTSDTRGETASLEVKNGSGAFVAGGTGSTLQFKATANTVYLVVYGEDTGGQGGTYKVSLRQG